MKTKLLSKADIEAIIRRVGLDKLFDELIDLLKFAFAQNDLSNAKIPPRTGVHYSYPDLGLIEWMPASIGKGSASLKLVAHHPTNPVLRGLPTVISSICVFDTDSGHLEGLLDGTFLTALRTGAMSAVASSVLARQDNATLGIIGCGAQSVTQVHALSRVLDIERIIAFDTDSETLSSFANRIDFLDIPVLTIEESSISFLLRQSDVLCTSTSREAGTGPLFEDFENKSGLHINAIGSDLPEKSELPLELLKRSFVCPDFREQALVDGECQLLDGDEVFEDLSGLLKQPDLSAEKRKQLSVFDSTGHAYADYVTGLLFLEYAERFNLGAEHALECIPEDPKNPYSFLSHNSLSQIQRAPSVINAV